MKFGGHETFFVRPNWLTKGLFLLNEGDDVSWSTNEASDAMGVGRNMSRSIGWWLKTIGLSERPEPSAPLQLSPFGKVVLENDPYFSDLGTWWFVHLSLAFGETDRIFGWFFQLHRQNRFKRTDLIEALQSYLVAQSEKVPSQKFLQREVAVLLQSYSRSVPAPYVDPEENSDCPLRRLGLLVFQSELDHYDRRTPKAHIPPHVIAAGLSLLRREHDERLFDVDLDGEGEGRRVARSLNVDTDTFAQLVTRSANALGSKKLATRFLAGERVASVRSEPLDYWVDAYFKSPRKSQTDRVLEAAI
ncbi:MULTISPECIES: DUF4007 family protein [unclassified Ruegeria]|uniref:DUF4007 family protein n=1 Tax=unclassified Ruegeria TaxID=2625375 RepID=UPI0014922BA4|nr:MULTISPECIES: DUF4007 family protein [unclassified Ruegeria]NOD36647.1 DUF4007 family protein [Ruegeria sp. HKCCD7296]NOE43854.1 DUF4007 family protein [Ruegeria sp. HKCCD7319]